MLLPRQVALARTIVTKTTADVERMVRAGVQVARARRT